MVKWRLLLNLLSGSRLLLSKPDFSQNNAFNQREIFLPVSILSKRDLLERKIRGKNRLHPLSDPNIVTVQNESHGAVLFLGTQSTTIIQVQTITTCQAYSLSWFFLIKVDIVVKLMRGSNEGLAVETLVSQPPQYHGGQLYFNKWLTNEVLH